MEPPAPSGLAIFVAAFLMLMFITLLIKAPAILRHYRRPKSTPTPARPAREAWHRPRAQTEARTEQAAAIGMREWLAYVNYQPDTNPHLAIVGGSGVGKTTVATAVLQDRPGEIAVITAKEGDGWGGLPYIGIDDDATYTTANRMFAALDVEVRQRLIATKRRASPGAWLTIVLDDYSTLRTVCSAADEPFKLIARLGRSLRVRLIVLSDSANVKAWGIEGEGETRNNFAFMRLARNHTGTIEIEGRAVPIDTQDVPRLAARADLAARWWDAPEAIEVPATAQPAQVDPATVARVTVWIVYEPEISNREIARRLWPDTDGGGRYSVKAKEIREIVEGVLLDSVTLLPAARNTPQ